LLGASNAAAFVALGPIMAALMAIPVLGEWPSHIADSVSRQARILCFNLSLPNRLLS
jgi:hypothetical protein